MAEFKSCLQSLGFLPCYLKNSLSSEMIQRVSLEIQELPSSKLDLASLAQKLLTVVEDSIWSPLWLVLLDKLSQLAHFQDVQDIYSRINQKQTQLYQTGCLPEQILWKLWMSHLPCLEVAVLTLVEHVSASSKLLIGARIRETLEKSCLVLLACQESILYETVFRMLMTMTVDSNNNYLMLDIISTFSTMVQENKAKFTIFKEGRIVSSLVTQGRLSRIEMMLRLNPRPNGISDGLTILRNLHLIWKEAETLQTAKVQLNVSAQDVLEQQSEEDALEQQREDLWVLTICYQPWVSAACCQVLTCPNEYVDCCVWLIAASHRIKFWCKDIQSQVENVVLGLRNLINCSSQKTELASKVIGLAQSWWAVRQASPLDTSEPQGRQWSNGASMEALICCLLMAFVFCSPGGFTIGQEITAFITNSADIADHVQCLVYFYHKFAVNLFFCKSVNRPQFSILIADLRNTLEKKHSLQAIPDYDLLYQNLNMM